MILKETGEPLEEGKTLADGKCEPTHIVYMVFKLPDTEDEWEVPEKEVEGPKA